MTPTVWDWPGSRISRVIDGDSFEATVTRIVSIDLGFRQTQSVVTSFPIKLRLNRINCPPASTKVGKQATARVKELVAEELVDIETLNTYKYGGGDRPEWMAEVILEDGSNLSDLLVAEGLAVYWDGEGPRPGG